MAGDWDRLYREIGRHIETMPAIDLAHLSQDAWRWLARSHALVQEVDRVDAIQLKVAMDNLDGLYGDGNFKKILSALYRALATVERRVSPGLSGAFIPTGAEFDTFAALAKVLGSASKDVMIVDPYLDETVLTDFGLAVPERVPLRLLADSSDWKASLKPAAERWIAQYGAGRPLAVRLAAPRALHDRAIFLDRTTAWTVSQSFKDLAKRSPAEIVRVDDIAARKIPAYEDIWANSPPLV